MDEKAPRKQSEGYDMGLDQGKNYYLLPKSG